MGIFLSHFGAFAEKLSSTNCAKFYRRVFVSVVNVSGSNTGFVSYEDVPDPDLDL